MIYNDRKEKIYATRKGNINEQRKDKSYDDHDGRLKVDIQKGGIHKEIMKDDRNRKIYEEHRARLNGIRLRVQNRRSPKVDDINEREQDNIPGPSRKDVPPNPYSHTDYMDYADLYHSPVSDGNDKVNRSRTMSPVTAPSSRTLPPAARPTSPTRPVSPTTTSSIPLSPSSRSLSPASRQMSSPMSEMSDRDRRRRSGSRERKGGRQLHFESPIENGHGVPQQGRARTRGHFESPVEHGHAVPQPERARTRNRFDSPVENGHIGPQLESARPRSQLESPLENGHMAARPERSRGRNPERREGKV